MTTRIFDNSSALNTQADISTYLKYSFEDGTLPEIKLALKDAIKARAMSDLAIKMGVSREYLYNMLSDDSNPTDEEFEKLLGALGVKI